jgi:hypothetical protein
VIRLVNELLSPAAPTLRQASGRGVDAATLKNILGDFKPGDRLTLPHQ